jgi:NADH dehydrogenase FAD-containing subunit
MEQGPRTEGRKPDVAWETALQFRQPRQLKSLEKAWVYAVMQAKAQVDVYAIGDIAALEGPDWVAKQGHIAELMGRNAAYNIIETEKGTNRKKGYQDRLNI